MNIMCGIPGEDEYWERRREEVENPRSFRMGLGWDDEPVYQSGHLYLDDEIDDIEAERGYPMDELYEGDLLEILEEKKGIVADSAVWDGDFCSIDYRVKIA